MQRGQEKTRVWLFDQQRLERRPTCDARYADLSLPSPRCFRRPPCSQSPACCGRDVFPYAARQFAAVIDGLIVSFRSEDLPRDIPGRRLSQARLHTACVAEQYQPPLGSQRAGYPPRWSSHEAFGWIKTVDGLRKARFTGGRCWNGFSCCRQPLKPRSHREAFGRNGMNLSGLSSMTQ
jgi:hypothetical protein